ncbi:MAG: hypothetical protein IMF11_14690 [Proteobacteria bacterium]|nr:hypothetical protein [Pseudomonadota bacterium]
MRESDRDQAEGYAAIGSEIKEGGQKVAGCDRKTPETNRCGSQVEKTFVLFRGSSQNERCDAVLLIAATWARRLVFCLD